MKKLLLFIKKKIKNKGKLSEVTESLHSLSPKIITNEKELKSVKPYLEYLRRCIEDEGITNIAVTGTYGSGKSTVLKSFQSWYKPFQDKQEDKYLNISLASFDAGELKLNGVKAKDFERRVELSILQQMFYQVKPGLLPASRFKRIKNINSIQLIGYIAFIILWLASFSTLVNFEFLKKIPLDWFTAKSKSWWNIIPWSILIFGIGAIIWKLFYLFNNSRIHKVSIKGEMILGDMGESVFNQYLEEILYFFERTKYEIVIIEDIDRFGDTQLFTKLREVNILLNTSKPIKRKIKFVYAVRDDIFKDRTERTKFFDYIIPIIPFVDPHNASEQLIQLLDNNNELSSDFIEDITSFIGDIDMRLIINIFNEFNLYRKKISAGKLEKLMAIVFYKNLYPDDFAALHQDKGKLFDLISKKKDYQSGLRNKYESRIDEIDEQIEKINSEWIKDIEELRSIYLFKLLLKLPEIYQFNMDFVEIKDALLDGNFKKLSSGKPIKYKIKKLNTHYHRVDIKDMESNSEVFNEVENEVSDLSYVKREENIRNKANGELERLRKKKSDFSNKIHRIELKKFSELFEEIGKDEDFEDFEKEGKLTRYLLLQGFIDDDYRDYISLFFDISITREDYEFIQNVKLAKSPAFDFKPSNSRKIIAKINKSYFNKSSILNYELVSYCLRNKNIESDKLNLYKSLLSTNDSKNLKFIIGFANTKPDDLPLLITEIISTKTNLWNQLLEVNLPEKELQKWVAYIFDFSYDVMDILKLEGIDIFKEYVVQQRFFEFASLINNVENLEHFLLNSKIKIAYLDKPNDEQNDLFQFIYENNFFELNIENIIQITSFLKPETNLNSLKNSNYSTLKNLKLDLLLKIVDQDFVNYTNRILLSENNRKELEDTMIDVLNRKELNIKTKEHFLLHQNSSIQSLYEVKTLDVKKIIMDSDKLIPNWINVFNYLDSLENDKFDITLIDFLNKKNNYINLSKYKIRETKKDDEYLKAFDSKLIKENKLNNEAYSKLLNSLRYSYTSFGLDKIDKEKVLILIKQKVLSFTKSNYDEIILSTPGLAVDFLTENQMEGGFESKIEEFDINDDVLIEIITLHEFNESHKINIVEKTEDNRIISNVKLAECIFNWWTTETNISFSFEVLETIFKSSENSDKKIAMLLHFIEKLDKSQLKELTILIGKEFGKLFVPFQQPKFDSSKNTSRLIKILVEKQLVSSFKEGKKNISAYPFNK